MRIFIFILLTALVILTVISYALCVMAHEADERAERMYRKWKEEHDERSRQISDRLIRRSDAIEAIEVVDWYHQNRSKDMVSGANSDEHQAWYKADDVYKALEAVPSADRPQGEWIMRKPEEEGFGAVFQCSRCSCEVDCVPTNFCPNCGADMRKESE